MSDTFWREDPLPLTDVEPERPTHDGRPDAAWHRWNSRRVQIERPRQVA